MCHLYSLLNFTVKLRSSDTLDTITDNDSHGCGIEILSVETKMLHIKATRAEHRFTASFHL